MERGAQKEIMRAVMEKVIKYRGTSGQSDRFGWRKGGESRGVPFFFQELNFTPMET